MAAAASSAVAPPSTVQIAGRPSVPVSCFRHSGSSASSRALEQAQQLKLNRLYHEIQTRMPAAAANSSFEIVIEDQSARWQANGRVVKVDLLVLAENDPVLKTALCALNTLMGTDIAKGEGVAPDSGLRPHCRASQSHDRAFRHSNVTLQTMGQYAHDQALAWASRVKAPDAAARARIETAHALMTEFTQSIDARIQALGVSNDDDEKKRCLSQLQALRAQVGGIDRTALYTALVLYEEKCSTLSFWLRKQEEIQGEMKGWVTAVDQLILADEQAAQIAGQGGPKRSWAPKLLQGKKEIPHDPDASYAKDVVALLTHAAPASVARSRYHAYCEAEKVSIKQEGVLDLIFRAAIAPTKRSTEAHRDQVLSDYFKDMPPQHRPQMNWRNDRTRVTRMGDIFDDEEWVTEHSVLPLLGTNFQDAAFRRELQGRCPQLFKTIVVEGCDVGLGNSMTLRGRLTQPHSSGVPRIYSTWDGLRIPMYCTGATRWEAVVPVDLEGEFKPSIGERWLNGANYILQPHNPPNDPNRTVQCALGDFA